MDVIEAVAHSLATRPHSLWLGAGCSYRSGVPTVTPLCRRIFRGLGLTASDISDIEYARVPFEVIFEVLLSATDCRPLFEVFRGDTPTLAHLLAAQLAAQGLVRTIVTTNFDTLLEDALKSAEVDFTIYASDEDFQAIEWQSAEVRVIKLHGTLEAVGDLALTIRRVAARQRMDVRGQVVRDLLARRGEGDVVIAGYSCSDHFDISPAVRGASGAKRRILYVAHSDSSRSAVAGPLRDSHSSNPFADLDAIAIECDTEQLFRATWQATLEQPAPRTITPTHCWVDVVDRWLAAVRWDSDHGLPSYIGGLLLKAANAWSRSNECLSRSMKAGLSGERRPRAMLAVGNNYRDMSLLDEAERTLRAAASEARAGGHAQSEARVLNSLGIVAEDRRCHELAIWYYQDALALASEQDHELQGKCYGNRGIAYKNRNLDGDLERALTDQEKALAIAVDIGDKRSEGRTLGNIGLIYRGWGDLHTSCKYYERARLVAESLGDRLHVAIWIHNTGEDQIQDDPSHAASMLRCAAKMFRSLDQASYAQESEQLLRRLRVGR